MNASVEEIGAIVTGGLAARELDHGHAHGGAAHGACANCGTALQGPHCHACGQAGHIHRNATGLLHDIAHGVFHFEGRTWHTLPLLALKPGELTRRYIDGERAKFVSPMALFLFSVFLMFAVVSSWTEASSDAIPQRIETGAKTLQAEQRANARRLARARAERATADPDKRERIDRKIADLVDDQQVLARVNAGLAPAAAQAAAHGKTEAADGHGNRQVDTGIGWLDAAIEHAGDNPQLLIYKIKTSAYKYSWALIPISLPFIWLLFPFSRRYGLYDHAIFATYSLAAMSLLVVILVALAMAGVPGWPLWLALFIVPPVHMYRQLKGTYRLGRWGAGWRTAALLLTTSITSAIFGSILLAMGMSH